MYRSRGTVRAVDNNDDATKDTKDDDEASPPFESKSTNGRKNETVFVIFFLINKEDKLVISGTVEDAIGKLYR
jgi:hypothetical protein